MKKNKVSKNWLTKHRKDQFFRQSKIHGYRSRAAYKLIEMNKKFKFLNKKTLLLDLGSSPGGWSQVASSIITKGKILAVDINPMAKINKVNFLLGDLKDSSVCEKIFSFFEKKIDIVMSDIATNTSGNKNLDSYRTGELCLEAMDLAYKILDQNGVFLSKIFMGSVFLEIHEKAKKSFEKVVKYKPLSSRKESKEIYIYCKGISKV